MPSQASRDRQQDKRNDNFASELIKPILEAEDCQDDEMPLEIQSETLKHYVDDLRKLQDG